MKTKLLYVLVSSEKDIYLEQAYVSMFSAKTYMPDCHIVLLVDKLTSEGFTGIRKKETSLADEMVVVDLDRNMTAQKRSRILKTGARCYVNGDFLYIDCDTIIVRDLSCIDILGVEIGACRDTHADFQFNPYREMCIRDVKKLGRDISDEKNYFNSGVMYVKDTPRARMFYKEWKKNYTKGFERGVSMDQPSLALTNIELGYPINNIPDIWNCELKHGVKYLKDAYIVHYLCTNASNNNDKQLFLLNEISVFENIKNTGYIPDIIKDVVNDPFLGLADTTHCFAGNDIYFFQTKCFSFFINRFKNGSYKIFETIIKIGSSIRKLLEWI